MNRSFASLDATIAEHSASCTDVLGEKEVSQCANELPAFEGCSADTIMEVAVWGPVTNDCVDAVGTSVP